MQDETDPVAQFIGRLAESAADLEKPVSWYVAPGRRRSRRQMNEAIRQREKQLGDVETALGILQSKTQSTVKFFQNEKGKVVGFKTSENNR